MSHKVCALPFSNFKTLKTEMNDKADEHLLLCVTVKVTDKKPLAASVYLLYL